MKKLHEFRNSGASAREWRGQVALLAKANKPIMRTLQFPLDLSVDQKAGLPLGQLREIYNVTDGTGPGSLYRYWSTVILSGFRIFQSGKAASMYRQAALFKDEEWRESFKAKSGQDWENFVPSKIIGRLLSLPRATGGKDLSFEPELIAGEFHKFIAGTSITDKTPDEERDFYLGLGEAIAQSAESWQDAGKNLSTVMAAIDRYLNDQHKLKLPSLESIAKQYGPTKPDDATIAYVGKAVDGGQEPIYAVFATSAERYGKEPDNGLIAHVQEDTITGNASGLSWLFGAGLEYFRSTDISQVMQDFDIDVVHREQVELVIKAARELPAINLFSEKHYAKFRPNFAGKVNSWIANYGKRLLELRQVIGDMNTEFALPVRLESEQGSKFFSGTNTTYAGVMDLMASIATAKDDAKSALDILCGQRDANESQGFDWALATIEKFSESIDTLFGVLNMVRARIEKEIEIAEATRNDAQLILATDCKFDIPKWLSSLPKINRFTGGTPDVNATLEIKRDEFNLVQAAMQEHFVRIDAWCRENGHALDPYARIAEREANHIKGLNPKIHEIKGEVRAKRNILQRILKLVMACSDPVKQELAATIRTLGVFARPEDANRHIFEQKGMIYRSAFDRSRHTVYKLNDQVLMDTDWLAVLDEWVNQLKEKVQAGNLDRRTIEDWQRLGRGAYAIRLSGLPNIAYPGQLARTTLPQGVLNLPVMLALELSKPEVSAEVLQKVFNQYSSVLSGLAFALFRKEFIIKLRFQRQGDNALLYAPKQKAWNIPERLFRAETAIGIACRKLPDSMRASVMPEEAVSLLLKEKELNPDILGAFMVQSPHDWFYSLGVGGDSAVRAMDVSKGKLGSQIRNRVGVRLIGGQAYKTVLDRHLTNEAEVGDITVVFELQYAQNLTLDSNGQISVTASHQDTRAVLSVPVTETRKLRPADAEVFFNRVVAIDLGETGIGYAVFDARTKEMVDKGFHRIPSIKRMMRRTRHYQDRPNIRQKFQSLFNINMAEVRENVVGDVCHQINRLCAYYKGFPVMESMTGNTGNKQLDAVYTAVVNRYTYSSTEAHRNERKGYWMGSEQWQHPYLMGPEYKDGKPTGKAKPLNLFPGVGVGSKGTSQECSSCRRNPVEALSTLKDTEQVAVNNGRIKVSNETLLLFERPAMTTEELKKLKQQQKRVPYDKPLSSGLYKATDLRRIMRANLRRAPEQVRTKDSTQSRYCCVFADCGNSMHADTNAAINIGRKFFETRTVDNNPD